MEPFENKKNDFQKVPFSDPGSQKPKGGWRTEGGLARGDPSLAEIHNTFVPLFSCAPCHPNGNGCYSNFRKLNQPLHL